MTRGGAAGVGLASAVAGAAGLVVLLLMAKVLDRDRNADFLAFWGLLFTMFGVLAGLQNEVTRAVRSGFGRAGAGGPGGGGPDAGGPVAGGPDAAVATTSSPSSAGPGARVLPQGLLIGAALAVAIGATSPLWAPAVLGSWDAVLVGAVCVATIAFAGHASVAGALAGSGRWPTFGLLVASEASVRLLAIGLAVVVGALVVGPEVGAAAAAGTWLLLVLLAPRARAAASARGDVDAGALRRRAGQAMVAAASSAVLVVGFPVLLRLTSAPEVYDAAAPLLLAVTLTRAPLLVPLGAFQGVAITHVLDHRERGIAALRPVVAAVLAVGALGAVLAWLIGPWLLALLRPDYRVDGPVLAGLTVAAALLALVTLTGAAVLALDRHGLHVAGWLAATAVSVGLLALPLEAEPRTVLALAVGPLVGIAVHAVGLRRGA